MCTMDSTSYLENCTLRGNKGTVAGAIIIASSDLKLSNTAFLENKADVADDIHYEIGETKFINKLYTYRSEFKRGNVTIRSDVTDFKHIAHQKRFMVAYEQDKTNLEMKETQFASSKNFFITLLAMIWPIIYTDTFKSIDKNHNYVWDDEVHSLITKTHLAEMVISYSS